MSRFTLNETRFSVDGYDADYCYFPPTHGLHVCDYHPDGVNCLTGAVAPVWSPAEAQRLFEIAKAECACAEGEPDDLIVDLQQGDDCVDDFPMTRQMLSRLQAVVESFVEARPEPAAGKSPGLTTDSTTKATL